MRVVADPAHPNPWLGAWLCGVLLLAGGVVATWVALGLPLPACGLRTWLGIPCPTCGSTRLVQALLRGEVGQALTWNPLLFLSGSALLLGSVLSVLRRLTGRPPLRVQLQPGERRALRWLAAGVLLAGWIYLILRGV